MVTDSIQCVCFFGMRLKKSGEESEGKRSRKWRWGAGEDKGTCCVVLDFFGLVDLPIIEIVVPQEVERLKGQLNPLLLLQEPRVAEIQALHDRVDGNDNDSHLVRILFTGQKGE